MKHFRIKNWSKFQHYKNRRPPWIKIYTSILSEVDGLMSLPDAQKAHVFMLFLAAAMNDNKLPFDDLIIRKLIRSTEPVDLQAIHRAGVIEFVRGRRPAITKPLEPNKEIELEIETEVEKEKEYSEPQARRATKPARRNPLDQSLTDLIDFFKAHPKRKATYIPNWARDKKLLRPYLIAKGEPRVREMLEAFVRREEFITHGTNFNGDCVLDAPLDIPSFIAQASRIDTCFDWDTKEKGYEGKPEGPTKDSATSGI